jgi:hypothetical protein
MHFRQEFGSSAVFTLEGASDDEVYERFDTANRNRANPLFDASLTHSGLAKRLRHGRIRHLTIPETSDDVTTPAVTHDAEPVDAESTQTADSAAAEEKLSADESSEIGAGSASEAGTGSELVDSEDTGRPDGSAEADDTTTANELINAVDEAVSSSVDVITGDNANGEEKIPEEQPESAAAADPLYDDEDLKLFAIDNDGRLYIYGAGERITLKPGWHLIVLTPVD